MHGGFGKAKANVHSEFKKMRAMRRKPFPSSRCGDKDARKHNTICQEIEEFLKEQAEEH